jgi:hypothetical protein
VPEVGGTIYHDWANLEVIGILEGYRILNQGNHLHGTPAEPGLRLRLHYGDRLTGEDWMDTNDVTGYISRSTGDKPIPILCANARSTGGSPILTECIVRIRTAAVEKNLGTPLELWRHPSYHLAPARARELLNAMGEQAFKRQWGRDAVEQLETVEELIAMKSRGRR